MLKSFLPICKTHIQQVYGLFMVKFYVYISDIIQKMVGIGQEWKK